MSIYPKSLSFGVLIPARFKSSRLPGKPLVLLDGMPMIQHVYERCAEAVGAERVYVATDDKRISEVVLGFGGQVVMTPDHCLTGTDRLAEANKELGFEFVINVQGDEPLVAPASIRSVVDEYIKNPGRVINGMCVISEDDDFRSVNVPKVVFSLSGRLCYMSRVGVPGNKKLDNTTGYKQVCIYAFSKEHLEFFLENSEKTPLENLEDIEILRFIENDIPVQMVDVGQGSIAVDVPEDIEKVEQEIKRRKSLNIN